MTEEIVDSEKKGQVHQLRFQLDQGPLAQLERCREHEKNLPMFNEDDVDLLLLDAVLPAGSEVVAPLTRKKRKRDELSLNSRSRSRVVWLETESSPQLRQQHFSASCPDEDRLRP